MRPSRSIRRATVRVAMPKTPRAQDEIAELAALADGSLAPEDRASLEARVDESPELAARLAEQERAVAFARSAAAEVEAPAALRARIEAQRSARARRAAARRPFVLIGAAAAVAALAIGIGLNVFRSGA
jgi:anti-sigma factor RsiW